MCLMRHGGLVYACASMTINELDEEDWKFWLDILLVVSSPHATRVSIGLPVSSPAKITEESFGLNVSYTLAMKSDDGSKLTRVL